MTQPYQPSNGTDGMMFMSKFCDRCIHEPLDPDAENHCKLILYSMVYEPGDKKYPKEWVEDDDGRNPRCTKFEERGTGRATPGRGAWGPATILEG